MKNKLPTINIKGKEYVMVKDRILAFNELYKNGSIVTEIVSNQDKKVVIKAIVTPDVTNKDRYFTGYSQADEEQGMINKTSALENAETSAVGRALAMLGIGIIDSVASADEVHKATTIAKQPTTGLKTPIKGVSVDPVGVPSEQDQDEPAWIQGNPEEVCKNCGSPMLISKRTGKPYCSQKCWLKK